MSVAGDFFSYIAVSWLTLELTGSSLALGTVLLVQGVSRAALMILGGALTDRWSARLLMILSASFRAVLMAAIAIDTATSHVHLWHLYAYSALLGTLGAFFLPAQSTMLPRLVPGDLLEAGNATINIGTQAARVIGPAVAGLIVARYGPAPSFAIDGACFVVSAVSVVRLRIPATRKMEAPQGLLRSIGAGFAYVWTDRSLLFVLGIVIALNFALSGPMQVGLVLLSRERFGGADSLGVILAASAVGSIAGTVAGGTLHPRRLGLVFIFLPLGTAVVTALFSTADRLLVAMGLALLFGACTGFINVLSPSWIQRRTDQAVLGRVMALVNLAALGAVPLSVAVAGAIGQVSVAAIFAVSAAAQAAAAGAAATSRTFRRI